MTVPGNGTVESNIALKPFIGFPGEIAYDDGTAENARAFNAADNAWAVRMTPALETAQVTGASFRFWNTGGLSLEERLSNTRFMMRQALAEHQAKSLLGLSMVRHCVTISGLPWNSLSRLL